MVTFFVFFLSFVFLSFVFLSLFVFCLIKFSEKVVHPIIFLIAVISGW